MVTRRGGAADPSAASESASAGAAPEEAAEEAKLCDRKRRSRGVWGKRVRRNPGDAAGGARRSLRALGPAKLVGRGGEATGGSKWGTTSRKASRVRLGKSAMDGGGVEGADRDGHRRCRKGQVRVSISLPLLFLGGGVFLVAVVCLQLEDFGGLVWRYRRWPWWRWSEWRGGGEPERWQG
ncbi:pollen-specific leucine-rich repeat extensin-like protein 3 [Iris pallida]|uniref:Pollen-specific leucine-rich repeat extensin-like protein 3 n=1 Tax=Iris pallida TaxID=29817 RepID=A0AAX6F1F6_IRIPA|nr:pollen-specific leucine-rich repeat extensin-like protein 3 [Iris pallida]